MHLLPILLRKATSLLSIVVILLYYSTAQSNKSSVYSGNLAVPIKPDNFVQATNMAPPLNNSTPPNQYPVQISQSHQHLTSDIYPKMYTSNDQNGAYRMTRSSE